MPPLSIAINSPHAVVGNDIFTCLQTRGGACGLETLHHLPSRDDAPQPTSLILDDIWNIHWIRPEAPFMLLVPTHRRPFDNPLFACLDYVHDIPVERNPTSRHWSLRADLILEWETLEANLLAVWWAMLKACDGRMPKDIRYWAWPCRYGYRLTYGTRNAAQIVAARSRNAFIPLMASISFSILVLNYLEDRYPSKYQNWREEVIASSKLHHEWFSLLAASEVMDCSALRVGGIVDMSTCDFANILPALQEFDMPLLLCWGPISDRPLRLPDPLAPFAPDHRVISSLRSRRRVFSSTPPSNHPPSTEPLAGRRSFPPVEPYSHQRPNETMKEFFDRRKTEADNRKDNETPLQKQARLQRDANVSRNREPGRSGARVYWWENVDGFRIRRAAGRLKYRLYWEEDGWERRYDPVFNEWDICSEFSDTEPNSRDMNMEDDDDDTNPNIDDHFHLLPEPEQDPVNEGRHYSRDMNMEDDDDTNPNIDDHFHLLPEPEQDPVNEGRHSSVTQLERIHQILHAEDVAEARHVAETHEIIRASIAAEDVAYSRFGFIFDVTSANTTSANTTKKYSWRSVQRSLGLYWGNVFAPPQPAQDALTIFFQCQLKAKKYTDMPPAIYDLLQPDKDVHRRKVTVRCETLGDKKYYFLLSLSGDRCSYQLALTSAASVVQVLRCQWGPTLSDIARQLLARGIPFNTFIRAEFRHMGEKLVPRFRGLGYRPSGYKPDKIDYVAYLARRERLLSSPRGRAALLHGGLVARIARAYVNFDDVCQGPTSNVMYDGFVLRGDHGVGYWDDKLTSDELDIICGVYCVDTGRRQQGGAQIANISFWPPPHIWEATGLDVGHWSNDCESWFIKREQELKAGTAILRRGQEWRHSLQFSNQAKRTVKNNDVLASQYLSNSCMPE